MTISEDTLDGVRDGVQLAIENEINEWIRSSDGITERSSLRLLQAVSRHRRTNRKRAKG